MRTEPTVRRRQGGTTLLIALVFLVILTLFAVSGMNTGVINLRTANNSQMILEAEYAAQQQIEQLLSSVTTFLSVATPPPTNVDVNGDSVTDFVVTSLAPKCLSIKPAEGYSYEFYASAPKDTMWEVVSNASDSAFGASVTLRQGVKIRLPVNAICVN